MKHYEDDEDNQNKTQIEILKELEKIKFTFVYQLPLEYSKDAKRMVILTNENYIREYSSIFRNLTSSSDCNLSDNEVKMLCCGNFIELFWCDLSNFGRKLSPQNNLSPKIIHAFKHNEKISDIFINVLDLQSITELTVRHYKNNITNVVMILRFINSLRTL